MPFMTYLALHPPVIKTDWEAITFIILYGLLLIVTLGFCVFGIREFFKCWPKHKKKREE
jgi:hypothetical protein